MSVCHGDIFSSLRSTHEKSAKKGKEKNILAKRDQNLPENELHHQHFSVMMVGRLSSYGIAASSKI
jgi:hypothetical protein